MSKYKLPYHFVEYADEHSIYHQHVDDLLMQLQLAIGANPTFKIHEVGCGEGLILNQIGLRLGWRCTGNDADPLAVNMARSLCPHAMVDQLSNAPFCYAGAKLHVVLFADSLEHIENWTKHLEWAKACAEHVVIAVPDRHDAHGLRDFSPNSFDNYFSDWKCLHSEIRHARHLLIFKR